MIRLIFIFVIIFSVEVKAQTLSVEKQGSSYAIADSLYATGNFSQAINYYAKEHSTTAALQIARAYNAIGNFEKAITQYQSVFAQNPNLQIASFELGKLFLKAKEFDEARKLFSKLTGLGANNPEYHYYLGEAYRELDQLASSLTGYKKAVAIDSTHLRSLFQLGKYFVTNRKKEEAFTYIDMGLRFYADDVSLINLKALAYFNNEEYPKALPFFKRLVELGEQKEFIYEKLAYCYFKNWEFEKAKTTYKKVLAINDGNAEAYYNLGEVFFTDRQIDSAQYYYKEAIAAKKPFLAREYDALARIARSQEDIKMAFKYYQLAHEEDPDNAMIYFNVCTTADQLYEDPRTKLAYYEKFIERFGKKEPYMSQMTKKRISELKAEIHFARN